MSTTHPLEAQGWLSPGSGALSSSASSRHTAAACPATTSGQRVRLSPGTGPGRRSSSSPPGQAPAVTTRRQQAPDTRQSPSGQAQAPSQAVRFPPPPPPIRVGALGAQARHVRLLTAQARLPGCPSSPPARRRTTTTRVVVRHQSSQVKSSRGPSRSSGQAPSPRAPGWVVSQATSSSSHRGQGPVVARPDQPVRSPGARARVVRHHRVRSSLLSIRPGRIPPCDGMEPEVVTHSPASLFRCGSADNLHR